MLPAIGKFRLVTIYSASIKWTLQYLIGSSYLKNDFHIYVICMKNVMRSHEVKYKIFDNELVHIPFICITASNINIIL